MAKLNASAVYKVAKQVRASVGVPARLVVAGAGPWASALVTTIGGGAQSRPSGLIVADAESLSVLRKDDVVVAAAGDAGTDLSATVAAARRARCGLVVALPVGDASAVAVARRVGAYADELVEVDPRSAEGGARLLEVVARVAGPRGPALAGDLPALRPAVVRSLVRRVAAQNAAVGAVVFLPGADMPAMTLNQLRMVLQIGVAYGENVGPERVPEVLTVMAAALGLRTAARQALGIVPVGGWALKGAVGYAGTLALGEAAVKYYETGMAQRVPADPVRVKGLLTHIVAQRKRFVD